MSQSRLPGKVGRMSTQQLPVLVTGAAGFIGARFVESCAARGLGVVSVDKREHFAGRSEHSGLAFGEIVDREELQGWLRSNQGGIGAIVHLGACSSTTGTDEAYYRRMNVEYSQMLWAHASEHGLPLVYASSAATYGDGTLGYDDDEAALPRLEPLNVYGRSKQSFDVWALEQERQRRAPGAWAGFKFFNVYGYGERHKGGQASVVLHAYDQIRKHGRVRLFRSHREGIADGQQKRDFVSVDDVVAVLHYALEKPIARGIYNLGTGQARTFLDLAGAVFRALGVEEGIDFVDTPAAIRDKYQYFTEARMERLRAQGYVAPFQALEDGVARYLRRLGAR